MVISPTEPVRLQGSRTVATHIVMGIIPGNVGRVLLYSLIV